MEEYMAAELAANQVLRWVQKKAKQDDALQRPVPAVAHTPHSKSLSPSGSGPDNRAGSNRGFSPARKSKEQRFNMRSKTWQWTWQWT